MEDLEKKLSKLPKYELSRKVDFKIKFKIYTFMLSKSLQKFGRSFFHPHSLAAKVSLVALTIFVLLGSTAVYAVNNDHITPGNTLYPLKKTIENVEQKLSITKSAKVDTLNKISERRLKEALNLAEQDNAAKNSLKIEEVKDNIEQSIEEAVNNFDSAVETSQKIENIDNSKKTKENLKKKKESMVKYLDNISDIAKNKKDEQMVKKVDEAKQAIAKYDEILREENEIRLESKPKKEENKNIKNKDKDRPQDKDRENKDGRDNNSDGNNSTDSDFDQNKHSDD